MSVEAKGKKKVSSVSAKRSNSSKRLVKSIPTEKVTPTLSKLEHQIKEIKDYSSAQIRITRNLQSFMTRGGGIVEELRKNEKEEIAGILEGYAPKLEVYFQAVKKINEEMKRIDTLSSTREKAEAIADLFCEGNPIFEEYTAAVSSLAEDIPKISAALHPDNKLLDAWLQKIKMSYNEVSELTSAVVFPAVRYKLLIQEMQKTAKEDTVISEKLGTSVTTLEKFGKGLIH